MDYQLDLTAYRCPLPLLMTKKALQQLKQGELLKVLLNETATLNDFILLGHTMGVLVEQGGENEKMQLIFKKRKDA
ncbi:sulfurtransferase TusA family protein [Frederiksenia canicola]|uniref:TusA-related sulfurtransferase n=1 Tax=Frederiksenia canicola TaxID=123824 RepID=A0AAE6X6S8_9PAST|nr:sulfurtransferase TusA family protein [Frederiksenia canicola]QIM65352.1 hypothetical protein A4G17_07795 [Frederiksenia canicola]RPE96212.1 TusA-related sulfurtransferase [Frederiksenia canicola]